jgi:ABC-type sugar transport system, permease component
MVSETDKRRVLTATLQDRIFGVVNASFLAVVCIVVLYPLIYVLSASFSSPNAVSAGKVVLLPVDASLEGYKAVFKDGDIWVGYANSVFYMVVGTFIDLAVTMTAAYALSRKDLLFRKPLLFFFTFTLVFGGGIVPTYLVVKSVLGVNSRLDLLIPNAITITNLVIAISFIRSMPEELRESATIDGADDFTYFAKILLPLSGAIIGVLTMMYGLAHWNAFFDGFIYLQDKALFPLQVVLRNIIVLNEVDVTNMDVELMSKLAGLRDLMKFSLIVVASVPVIAIYPLIQRNFVKGMMIGSLKG